VPGIIEPILRSKGVPTRVFTAEHLCCVGLQTGRAKDKLRVSMFLEQDGVDGKALSEMASRWGLSDKLKAIESLNDAGG
jgi:hypothetical protein